jgi:putative hydrolase of the HAD superfamily
VQPRFVFDFGSVLFRWRPHELLRRALPQRAHDEASARHWVEQIFQSYGGDWGDFDRGTVDAEQLTDRITARTGLGRDEVAAVIDAVPHELAPIAPSVDLLSRLRSAGPPIYYLSNMPEPFAAHLERSHDFVGWFSDGVFSARVKMIKPEPEIFELASRRFGAAPAQLVFLDDQPANVQAARAAGWQALLFTDAPSCEQEIRRRGFWPAQFDSRP